MRMQTTDIDKLLEETDDLGEDFTYYVLSDLEIDRLLENTQDW